MPPTNEEFVVNNVWADNVPALDGVPLTLPSGQTVKARKLGIEVLLEAGIITEVESLSGLVLQGPVADGRARMQGHRKPAKQQEAEDEAALVSKVLNDPELLKSLITVADKALPQIVLEPKVEHHVIMIGGKPMLRKPQHREPGVIYTDQIGLEDKMFLFNWSVGTGNDDLSAFRNEPNPTVDAVGAEPSVPRTTKRAGSRKR